MTNVLERKPVILAFRQGTAKVPGHGEQVYGVAVAEDGKVLGSCILPSTQRLMLGLGVGDEKAHAHVRYRRYYPQGYEIEWVQDSQNDARVQKRFGKNKDLVEEARKEVQSEAVPESDNVDRSAPGHSPRPSPVSGEGAVLQPARPPELREKPRERPVEIRGEVSPSGEVTANLIKEGMKEASEWGF